MDALEAQIQDELSRILSVLEGITGLRSRWTGVVHLTDDAFARGRMSWGGDISINSELAQSDLRWRTLIHEALHTLSQGLTPSSYIDLLGWEEGVVEQLQRLLRFSVLSAIGIDVSEDVFAAAERTHEYNRYITAWEDIRQVLGVSPLLFYEGLLKVPLRDRSAFIIEQGQRCAPDRFQEFRRVYAAVVSRLRGD